MKRHTPDTPCARCGRPIEDGWTFSGWPICDRRSCVASATHGLIRGLLPDQHEDLAPAARNHALAFDERQAKNRPPPPPWARQGSRR